MKIIVDPEDEYLLARYGWYEEFGRTGVCIVRKTRRRGEGVQIRIPLAEEIFGKKEGFIVDHKNGDPYDNRRSNLRHCTIAQNNINRRQRKSGTGLTGVRVTPYGKWVTRLKLDGKVISKSFDSRDDAIAHRKELERIHFGEFARQS